MPIIFGGQYGGGSGRAFDQDVLDWEDAVIVNGGSVSLAQRIIYDEFIYNEKTSGAWDLTDDYWIFWAENEPQALTSIKQRRFAVPINVPTFVQDRHYLFDGLSSCIDLGFIPATHGVNITGTNQLFEVYERDNVASNGGHGVLTAANNVIFLCPRFSASTSASCRLNMSSVPTFALSPGDSRGLKSTSRAGGSNTSLMYDRGVRLTDVVLGTPGTSTPTHSLHVGAFNSSGTPSGFRPTSVGFCAIGAPLSNALAAARAANVQACATSKGANV
jgi:hypothetical protein